MERSYEAGGSIDAEGALPEAELREALRAELGRFVSSSSRHTQLGNKTDVISQLAREVDLSPKLARQYAEIARQQQSDERDEEKSPEDKQTGKPPLFRLFNHHTDDCGQAPAVDGDEPGKYFGYFANPHGEQTVFIYDYQTPDGSATHLIMAPGFKMPTCTAHPGATAANAAAPAVRIELRRPKSIGCAFVIF
jgi:hypothetical protein